MSVPSPGPVGTISRIGRVGQFCGTVCALALVSPVTAASAMHNNARNIFMELPTVVAVCT
jgi:hypothetical protein